MVRLPCTGGDFAGLRRHYMAVGIDTEYLRDTSSGQFVRVAGRLTLYLVAFARRCRWAAFHPHFDAPELIIRR